MSLTQKIETGERVNFSKIRATIPLPNLIAVQKSSYEQFLQMDLLAEERRNAGLQAVFTSVFPFSDFRSSCELHFVRYELGAWECKCGRLEGAGAPADRLSALRRPHQGGGAPRDQRGLSAPAVREPRTPCPTARPAAIRSGCA